MGATVTAMYFSPTGSSRRIALSLAVEASQALGLARTEWNVTAPQSRGSGRAFASDDILVFAFPVYAGRVPLPLVSTLEKLEGNNARAVVAAVYGNRDYDDALLEAVDMLTERGFRVIAASAVVAEHSLTAHVGTGRPDADDLDKVEHFAREFAAKIAGASADAPAPDSACLAIKGQRPYKERPPAVDIRPKTNDDCTECFLCAFDCPMGVISRDDPREVATGCIRCFACVKGCLSKAKYFDDERVMQICAMLESKCTARREPEFFI